MAAIEFVWDSRDLKVWRGRDGIEAALTRAVSKAGSDAARFMRTVSGRMVRHRKRFKAGAVREGTPLYFPRNRQSLESLVWEMKVSGKPMGLVDFPHRQTSKGVSVAVNTGKRSVIRSAFVAVMRSGHRGIFTRRIIGSKRVGRLPIDELLTTRLSDVFQDHDFVPFVYTGAQDRFSSAFDRLFALELEKIR